MADEQIPELVADEPIDVDREQDNRYGRGRRGFRPYYDDVYDADGKLIEPISILD